MKRKSRQVLKVVSNATASYFWVTVLSPLPFSFQQKKMIGSGCDEETGLGMQGLCRQVMEMGSRAWAARLLLLSSQMPVFVT